jgi:anti-sigma regulatory factor (Ser/Thr protein kinase)
VNLMDGARVELVIPLLAEYVSIARLTLSGVANRAGFDFDTIEDVKVSLSEVCNRLIVKSASAPARQADGVPPSWQRADAAGAPKCRIEFILSNKTLTINFAVSAPDGTWDKGGADDMAGFDDADGAGGADDESVLGLSLISVLMDEYTFNPGGQCVVSMKKYLET